MRIMFTFKVFFMANCTQTYTFTHKIHLFFFQIQLKLLQMICYVITTAASRKARSID